MKRAMTMLEIIAVLVIITVVFLIGLPKFNRMQENVLNKEAFANLRRLQEAQKFYNMEVNLGSAYYYPSSGTMTAVTSINYNLRVSLPSSVNLNWNYSTKDTGCVQSVRNGGWEGGAVTYWEWSNNRSFRLLITDTNDRLESSLAGTCP